MSGKKLKFDCREITILACLSSGLIILGVMNNVGASLLSSVMPAFPSWLLYGTTLMYTIVFFIIALIRNENPFACHNFKCAYQKHYLILALFTGLNGLTFQFAAAWVNGSVAQVLSNLTIVQLPFLEVLFF